MKCVVHMTHPEVEAWNFGSREESRLRRLVPEAEIRIVDDEAAFLEDLPEAEVVLVWRFEEAWLDRAPGLKWVATPSAGKERIPAAIARRVRVTHGTFHGKVMSETVVGMMLFAVRRLSFWSGERRSMPWPQGPMEEGLGLLRGSHAAILGFGPIGRAVAEKLKVFQVRITGIKRTPADPPDFFDQEDRIVTLDRLPETLAEADHLVVILPGTEETDFLLNRETLAHLPPHAWVYNVGRGNAIDEAALIEALNAGGLAGAFLDVFEDEPLPADSPLRKMDKVFLLPHASAICPEYLSFFVDEVAEQWGSVKR
ncbi:MAG: D-2-hydroxyacid dehydrogenase [Verrucomicrobiota bacterium]